MLVFDEFLNFLTTVFLQNLELGIPLSIFVMFLTEDRGFPPVKVVRILTRCFNIESGVFKGESPDPDANYRTVFFDPRLVLLNQHVLLPRRICRRVSLNTS